VFAASIKFKYDEASYNSIMSEVCTWWPKSNDPEYKTFCDQFEKDPTAETRRRLQEDFLYTIRDMALFPVQLVQRDCSKFSTMAHKGHAANKKRSLQTKKMRCKQKTIAANKKRCDYMAGNRSRFSKY